jgi:hypothetical protein
MKVGYGQIVPAIKTQMFFLRNQTIATGDTKFWEKQFGYV